MRTAAAALGAACLGAALLLAWHHPLAPAALIAGALAASAAVAARLAALFVIVPLLLPWIGLAPWTGWLTFEETDVLVLAGLAGAYARIAFPAASAAPPKRGGASTRAAQARPSPLAVIALLLLTASVAVSLARGVADAGGFVPGWFQGYREPMNSVRLAKSWLLALLCLPAVCAAWRADDDRASRWLTAGLVLGLGGCALLVVSERLAFTELLNFSSDYRATGPFWEMHVGGAALDGFLALTVPFAAIGLLRARSNASWSFASGVALLASYACLTTFSRGVYLAVPVGLAVSGWLHGRAAGRNPAATSLSAERHVLPALGFAVVFAVAAAWTFPTSGYRGLLALWGAFAALLALGGAAGGLRAAGWCVAAAVAVLLCTVSAALTLLLPKGAYLAYAASVALALAAALWPRLAPGRPAAALDARIGVAAYLNLLFAVVLVARHWGYAPAVARTVPVVMALAVALPLAGRRGAVRWPASLRWQGSVLALLAMVGAVVAIFSGGAYMSGRFSTGQGDLAQRRDHWHESVSLLRTTGDWLLGRGLGRYPDSYALSAIGGETPGDYRLRTSGVDSHLVLTGGHHMMGWGEIFRVSQRIPLPAGQVDVRVAVRVAQPTGLHFEVCTKHLLYDDGCQIKAVNVAAQPGGWQTVSARLDGNPLGGGAWYAPRPAVFSVAVGDDNGYAEIDNLSAVDSQGRRLLANGDFSHGMAHWFFSSDRSHLPWHAKNLLLGVLIDQGAFGVLAFVAVTLTALWQVSFGSARGHAPAPALAGAIVGFLVIGAFDTLLDAPRVAFLFYLLVVIALCLPRQVRPEPRRQAVRTVRPLTAAAPALLACGVLAGGIAWPGDAGAQAAPSEARATIRVGPQRAVTTLAEAARLARDGAVVEVDAGTYRGDVAVWTQNRLTLRAVNGRVRLLADGRAAEGKGIWVIRGEQVSVQGFDFEGAAVDGRNGAGIRFDRGSLLVRDCSFMRNEMGLLTGNDPDSVLEVEDSEFAHNLRPDGHNHNLYVGAIARFSVSGSYFHHASIGHLLKSRAAVSHVFYNRLTDEDGGRASYELEFPNGGVAVVVGNLIQQSPQTDNPALVSFGAEGYTRPVNELYLAHNTLVDALPAGGVFLRVRPGAGVVRAIDNLFVGTGRLVDAPQAELQNNFQPGAGDFDSLDGLDLRLAARSPLRGRAVDAGRGAGVDLNPTRQYVHPRGTAALRGAPVDPGAVQRDGARPAR